MFPAPYWRHVWKYAGCFEVKNESHFYNNCVNKWLLSLLYFILHCFSPYVICAKGGYLTLLIIIFPFAFQLLFAHLPKSMSVQ